MLSRYGWIYLRAAIAKNDNISHQSRRPFRYGCIYLRSAIVKNDSISHQSKRDPSRHGCIRLRAVIVKIDNISHQSRSDSTNDSPLVLEVFEKEATCCSGFGGRKDGIN
jgi:hypothetical protein